MNCTSPGFRKPIRSLSRSMWCDPIVAPSVGGICQRLWLPPGPLNEPRDIMSHGPGVLALRRVRVRVVVVVEHAEDVAELVRVDRRAVVLALGGHARRGWRATRSRGPHRTTSTARTASAPSSACSGPGSRTARSRPPCSGSASRRAPARRRTRRSRRAGGSGSRSRARRASPGPLRRRRADFASSSVSKSPSQVSPVGHAGSWPNSARPYWYSGRSIR